MRTAQGATQGFARNVNTQMVNAGRTMTNVGRRMTRSVTVPLLAVGAGAAKMATDFDTSMTRITALVGVGSDEVDGMRDSVMDLSGETARAPGELAEALFFVTSAGIKGAEALDVLEMSAKASAVGLGDTATIADLVTSAMNAYGSDTLSAADATDTLTAAVREGKLEPDALAGAMGRVLPMASALGVEFHEVGAGMAAMSRTGTTAREAATQLRSILQGILSPAQGAAEGFAEVGLTAEGLQSQLRDEGLLATLQTLVGAFDGNAAATEAVFGNIRALTGVMDLMGSNAQATEQIFDELTDTVGATDDAFEVMSETAGFKMQQAWVDMQAALVQAGDVILPVVTGIVEGIGGLASAFGDLPGPAQSAFLGIAGVVAAAGPLARLGGGIVTTLGRMGVGFSDVGRASRNAARGLGIAGAAIATGVILWQAFTESSRRASQNAKDVADGLMDTVDAMIAANDATVSYEMAVDGLSQSIIENHSEGDKMREALGTLGLTVEDLAPTIVAFRDDSLTAFRDLSEGFLGAGASVEDVGNIIEVALGQPRQSTVSGMTDEMIAAGEAIRFLHQNTAGRGMDPMIEQFLLASAASSELNQELLAQAESNTNLSRSGEDLVPLYAEYVGLMDAAGVSASGATDEVEGTTEAFSASGEAAAGAGQSVKSYTERLLEATGMDLAGALEDDAEAAGEAASEYDRAAEALAGYIGEIENALGSTFDHEKAQLQLADSYADLEEQIATTAEVLADSESTDAEKAQSLRDLRGEYIVTTEQALIAAQAYADQGEAAQGTVEHLRAQRDALVMAREQYPHLRDEIDLYIAKIDEDIPEQTLTEAKFETDAAQAAANDIAGQIMAQPDGESTAFHHTDMAAKDAFNLAMGIEAQPDGLSIAELDISPGLANAETLERRIGAQPDGHSTSDVNNSPALNRMAEVEGRLNALDGRTATSTANVVTNHITRHITESGRPGQPYATGTMSATPGVHLVGEKGPELVGFDGGERVLDANRTASLLAQAKSFTSAASLGFDGGSSTSNTFDQSRQAIVNVAGVEGAQLGRIVRDAVDDALWKAGAGG